ncbi:MAG: ATP-binding protein [Candidatus Omnitrophota bacterium]
MHPIAIIDLITFLASVFTLGILLKGWKRALQTGTKLLLAGTLLFTLVYSLCLFLEWAGITKALDILEDLIGALIPMWWAFVFYALLKGIAEKELRDSETRFKELFNNMKSAVAIYKSVDEGRDFIFQDFNRSGEKMEKARKEDIIGRPVTEVFPGVKEFGLFEVFQRVWRTGEPEHFPAKIYKDQRIVGWRDNYVYKLPTGEIVAIYEDITEKMQATEKIQSLAKFPEENPNPVLRISTKKILLYANDASKPVLEEFGCTIGEEIPRHCWDDVVKESVETGIISQKETEIRGRIILFSVAPVLEAGYVNIYGRDITERKRAEEELIRYREHLEELVKERTEELESFSYSVSHDLRAPLRAIDGFSNILKEDYSEKLDEEGKKVTDVIQENTRNMSQLIDDLLAFSRVGRQDMRVSEVDISSLAKEESERQKASAPERDIEFDIKEVPAAKGDRKMIQQALANLMSNSVKFTRPKEKAVIEIGATPGEDRNIYYIKDNGVGFNMEYKDKLFAVFQRLHGKDEFEGTGVGLAIVQRIIRRHGGDIWAEGKSGEGATFYFTLPKE